MNYIDVIVTPGRHSVAVAERWNPWRVLRALPATTFARAELPGPLRAVCAVWPEGDAVIVIDRALGRRARNVALAHELVHLERGGGADKAGAPPGWHPIVRRDELAVDREVARRLVPLDDLQKYVDRRIGSDLVTTPLEVAEEFDTTEQLAELAMLLLKGDPS